MNRLTDKSDLEIIKKNKVESVGVRPEYFLKLGQYEDIEELCERILKEPVYYTFVDSDKIIEKRYDEYDYYVSYNFRGHCIEVHKFYFLDHTYDINDYGRFWSFNKKDLEKERSN